MAPEDIERSAWLFARPLPQTDKAQPACKHHGHQWQSNLSTRPSRTLRLAKEGCFKRTSQQLQQCAAALPFALTIHVACPAPCSFDVRTFTPYPLRTPDGRRFSNPLPASVLPSGLRHRPCTEQSTSIQKVPMWCACLTEMRKLSAFMSAYAERVMSSSCTLTAQSHTLISCKNLPQRCVRHVWRAQGCSNCRMHYTALSSYCLR